MPAAIRWVYTVVFLMVLPLALGGCQTARIGAGIVRSPWLEHFSQYRPTPNAIEVDTEVYIEVVNSQKTYALYRGEDDPYASSMFGSVRQDLATLFTRVVAQQGPNTRLVVRAEVIAGYLNEIGVSAKIIDARTGDLLASTEHVTKRTPGQAERDMLREAMVRVKQDLTHAFEEPRVAAVVGGPQYIRAAQAGVAALVMTSERAPATLPEVKTSEIRDDALVAVDATGVGKLEQRAVFNVLDEVFYEAATGQITLIGHFDYHYTGPPIPYLEHLATLLDQPAPEFSLEWTPESERRVDDFLRRMDNMTDWQKVTSDSMQLVDAAGSLTSQAKVILPMLGVYPTRNGKAPGYLGAAVRLDPDHQLVVSSVSPNSPAMRAGVRSGDILVTTSLGHFFHPFQLEREMRAEGAGSRITLTIGRRGSKKALTIPVALGGASGDPWCGVGRKDLVLAVLRCGGKSELANMVRSVMDLPELMRRNVPIQSHTFGIYWKGNRLEKYNETLRLRDQGKITQQEGEIRVMRLIPEILDDLMGIPGRPITGIYDAKVRQGFDFGSAYDQAISEMERQLKRQFIEIWKRLVQQPREITIPLIYTRSTMGFSPQVVPSFTRLDRCSSLARAMFEADYLAKTMLHDPGLAGRIPGYQTLYAFERNRAGAEGSTTTERMWLSIDSLDLSQSPSGTTLRTLGAVMRFNIEGVGGRSVSEPYAKYLTSLYERIARAIPVFHELREAAKLAGVALWLRQNAPDLCLPTTGPAWSPPAVVPGAIYQTWSPQPGANRIVMMAMGGVSLVPPVGPAGPVWPPTRPVSVVSDPTVVDLRDTGFTAVPRILVSDRGVMARRLRRPTVPPVPRPAGWVARHEKGLRTIRALSIRPDDVGRCEAVEAADLGPDIEHALVIAEQLDGVETAINAITDQYPERQAAFNRWETRLEKARNNFIDNALDIVTQGLSSTYGMMRRTRLARRWGTVNDFAGDLVAAKDDLSAIERRVKSVAAFVKGVRTDDVAGRDEAVKRLAALAKEMQENSIFLGSDRGSQALRAVTKSLGYGRSLKGVVGLGGSLVTLGGAWRKIGALSEMTEKETQALRDTLLPLKRNLSDQLDDAMKVPAVQNWLAQRSLCR